MKLEDRVLQYLPLLAPVPTAWMVGTATYSILHFPIVVAVISALVIEGLGFVAVNTAIQMRDFNNRLSVKERQDKMQAPVWQAYGATALYTVVTLVMTVLLHVFPQLVTYAPIPFILMGVAGAWLYSLRSELTARIVERDKGREKAKQARDDKKKDRVQAQGATPVKGSKLHLQGASKPSKLQVQASKQPVQDEALLAYWRDNPRASDGQAADQFGTSRQAIQQRRGKLTNQGSIRMTDKGVEIIGISIGSQLVKKDRAQ